MAVAAEVGCAAAQVVAWALERGIVEDVDARWAYNRVLASVGAEGPAAPAVELEAGFDIEAPLEVLAAAAADAGLVPDTISGCDRAAMEVMGAIMPRPSEVARRFEAICAEAGSEAATDWFYALSCDVDYVRRNAIARNLEWSCDTAWGELEITINKSKPEKDPRDIAAAGAAPKGEKYPACQLCMENEGYAGRTPASAWGDHPARDNLRIVPIELGGEPWGLQYSPYAYYTEHCIAMSSEHRPMHVDRASLGCLLDFVDRFPHYFIGSNADLPIVGGSILSHDHFQGGRHEFPMAKAPVVEQVVLTGHESVSCGIVKWPMSVLRLSSTNREELLEACCHVADAWRTWSDESVGVRASEPDGTRHNTVTPICRMRDGRYEMDLALRCNVTSAEHPLGVFHPHEDKWHVKKENIGLIEVMGLAILPPRLEAELDAGRLTKDEVGRVFAGVLEDAGVFKWDDAGRAAMARFAASL